MLGRLAAELCGAKCCDRMAEGLMRPAGEPLSAMPPVAMAGARCVRICLLMLRWLIVADALGVAYHLMLAHRTVHQRVEV